jgi:purine-cytosine permease-like protein
VRLLERVAVVLVALALAIGLIAVLSGYFADHDQASVTTSKRPPAGAP